MLYKSNQKERKTYFIVIYFRGEKIHGLEKVRNFCIFADHKL